MGLQFRLGVGDGLAALLFLALPVVAFVFRDNLGTFLTGDDPTLVTYRLVAVALGGVIMALSWAIIRIVFRFELL